MDKQKRPYRRRCRGGLPNCKNYIGDYKDVDGVDCCKQCDDYVDENPYDPYWEQMEDSFSSSKEYEELEKNNLLEDSDAYEKAFEVFQETYESWYDMRRRMSKERLCKERAHKERADKERLCKEKKYKEQAAKS
jgi:hypothetical protein